MNRIVKVKPGETVEIRAESERDELWRTLAASLAGSCIGGAIGTLGPSRWPQPPDRKTKVWHVNPAEANAKTKRFLSRMHAIQWIMLLPFRPLMWRAKPWSFPVWPPERLANKRNRLVEKILTGTSDFAFRLTLRYSKNLMIVPCDDCSWTGKT